MALIGIPQRFVTRSQTCPRKNESEITSPGGHALHSSAYCLSLRAKYRYAPTFTKLITTPIMFHTITGREAINKP